MGLAAEKDFGSEQIDAALPIRGFDGLDAAPEILVAPGPAAAQGIARPEPEDGLQALHLRFRKKVEDGAVVEIDVHLIGEAVGQGAAVVDADPEDRSRDVKFLIGNGNLFSLRGFFHQVVGDRQAQVIGQVGGASDGQDRAAVLQEFFQGRDGFLGRDPADHELEFRGDVGRGCAAEAAPPDSPALGRGGNGARREEQDVEFSGEVSGVEGRSEDELEGKFELLQKPAGPARIHRSAVHVPQPDADRLQLEEFDRGLQIKGRKKKAQLTGGPVQNRKGGRLGRDIDRARGKGLAVGRQGRPRPIHLGAGFEQAIGDDGGVVELMA